MKNKKKEDWKRKSKKTFKELQFIILKTLKQGDSTIHDLAKKNSLHYHTVQRQLILLKGQDYVNLAFEHKKFRLFSITEKGKKYLKELAELDKKKGKRGEKKGKKIK